MSEAASVCDSVYHHFISSQTLQVCASSILVYSKMSKNEDLLKRVISKYFTEDVVKEIVSKDKDVDKDEINIVSWELDENIGKGLSNLSVITRAYINSELQNNYLETVLIVKALPKSTARRETYRCTEFFANEVIFYKEIAETFNKYLEPKDETHLFNIPKCMAYHVDGENDYIALQDVSLLGYKGIDKKTTVNYEQCKHVMKSLARFHSVSFAFKNENKAEFDRLACQLKETFYTPHIYETWYKRFHETIILRIAKDALAQECPGSEVEKRFNNYAPGELYKKCVELCHRTTAPTSVITQGDCWAPNFLIRETIPGKINVLILDFQLARSASPVLDIMFFIYACTDKKLRDSHYEQILKDYYDELTESCKTLGLDLNSVYDWERFMQEIKEQSIYGLTFAVEAIPFNVVDMTFDVDSTDNKALNIADIWQLPNLTEKEHRQRLVDVITHAVDNGYI